MNAYAGKNVVITGGSHEIGLGTAELLLERGARVLITGRSPPQSSKHRPGSATARWPSVETWHR